MTEVETQVTTPQQTSGETPSPYTLTETNQPQVPFENSSTQPPPVSVEEAKTETVTIESTTKESGPTTAPTYTASEIDAFRDKAEQFDLLDQDPGAVQVIKDYLTSKGADLQTDDPVAKTVVEGMSPEVQREFTAMRATMQQMHANMQIAQFSAVTPDFEQHKEAIGNVILKHPTFGLQEAYDHVKLTIGQKAGSEAQRTAPQTPEGRQNSPVTTTTESTLADVEAQIRDPKATKSIDEAFATAWKQAVAEETARTE